MHTRPIVMQGELKPGVKDPFHGRWICHGYGVPKTGLPIVDEALNDVVG